MTKISLTWKELKDLSSSEKKRSYDPFEQKDVWGYTQVKGHSKRAVVCTESEETFDESTSDECQHQIRDAVTQH